MRLRNQVAIVTGSGKGIGRGIAERFAQEGAAVVVVDRDTSVLPEAQAAVSAHGSKVLTVTADVSKTQEVARLYDETLKAFGTVDILVNNAAWAVPISHFLDMTEEFWDTVMNSNLKSMFLCSQRAARLWAEQKKPGSIVNMSSFGAARAHREMVAYDATKGGIEAATRAMAMDLAPWQIRVNCIGPGPIATPALLGLLKTEENVERMRKTIPLERLGQPSDIAGAALYFASDDASFITGQVLYVDGGVVAQLRPAAFERHQKRPP
ncbi:MAG: SDR family oxidoreductase [Anaerolineae bacterium]|nr:SDR family oxidoreductase [Anaerolineae bacterium]